MNSEADLFDAPGPQMGAYDQLMQLDVDLAPLADRSESESAGNAYDEALDAN